MAFFGLLLSFGADPFRTTAPAPLEGLGLQPALRHWAMVAHPPVLFLGYAGLVAPFALVCGALLSGEWDTVILARVRRWSVVSWALLGAGMALGAWWAYVELGWGGYWAWDPVENASLMPWLTATALVHAVRVEQGRGGMRGWTAVLAGLTCVLCVFGTFVTRSGVLQSVHAFARSPVGWYFLWLLAALVIGFGVLLWCRRGMLSTSNRGTESDPAWAVRLGNLCLLMMAAVVLVGTVFPLLSPLVLRAPAAVTNAFYNRAVAPLGLAVAGLVAAVPLMRVVYAGRPRGTRLAGPVVAAVAGVSAAVALSIRHPAALAVTAVACFGLWATVAEVLDAARVRSRACGVEVLAALACELDGNHRRYGGRLAHAGLFILLAGVVGSTLFSVKETLTLTRGQTAAIGPGSLRLESVRQVRGDGYAAAEAVLTLNGQGGSARTLLPQLRFYAGAGEGTAHVAIASSWREDAYVALLGWKRGGEVATLEVHVNPLASWVWVGAAIVVAGGLASLTPRLLPRGRVALASVPGGAIPGPAIEGGGA
jgi:cytochrome c-type biogenesis protein CcmF